MCYAFYSYTIETLADRGARNGPLSARTPNRWSRTNPNFGWGAKVGTTKNQNGPNLENKNYERLNVERPLLSTTFNARDQKFEWLKWREVKN